MMLRSELCEGPNHHFLSTLKIVLNDTGCKFEVVVLLQNAFRARINAALLMVLHDEEVCVCISQH